MANPIPKNVRIQMLGKNTAEAENVLSDDFINLNIDDAVSQTGVTDELALRYYTCYLISLNWESIGAVASREGVSYREPNPEKYLNMFDARIAKINGANPDNAAIGVKVSTNKDVVVDETDFTLRRRISGDDYWRWEITTTFTWTVLLLLMEQI